MNNPTPKIKPQYSLAFLIFVIGSTLASVADPPPALPSEIASLYESTPNWTVSDEFNVLDWNKWTHRYHFDDSPGESWGIGTDYVKIVNGDYLSVKGDHDTWSTKGSGLSAKRSSKYGFYLMRWKIIGNLTGWHPAIWGSAYNFGYSEHHIPNWWIEDFIEIDFFERNAPNMLWNSKAIGWPYETGGDVQYRNIRGTESNWQGWHVIGIEYHPDYVRHWSYWNGAWYKMGMVWFSNTNENYMLHDKFRKEIYAILSMKKGVGNPVVETPVADCWMHVDYYLVYDIK